MRDDLTCWDYVPEFTGQQAALAIVGEAPTDDPATLRKAMPVLDLMRRAYDGTRRWFADAPEVGDTAPRGLLVSVEMQTAKARVAQMDDVVADHPYCIWPRKTEHVSLLFSGELQRKEGQDSNLSDADAENWRYNEQNWRFLTWLRTPMADFDRQTFAREVLARWVQEVGASSLYPFIAEEVQAATADVQTPQSAAQGTGDASWRVTQPQRYRGYAIALHRLLLAAHREGKARPTAREVLEAWRSNMPHEIAMVLPNGIDYYDSNGNTKPANLEAIRQAISRMTSVR